MPCLYENSGNACNKVPHVPSASWYYYRYSWMTLKHFHLCLKEFFYVHALFWASLPVPCTWYYCVHACMSGSVQISIIETVMLLYLQNVYIGNIILMLWRDHWKRSMLWKPITVPFHSAWQLTPFDVLICIATV